MAEKLGPNNEILAKDMEIRGTEIILRLRAGGPTVHSCPAESFYSVGKDITVLHRNSSKARSFSSPSGIALTFQGQLHLQESRLTQ